MKEPSPGTTSEFREDGHACCEPSIALWAPEQPGSVSHAVLMSEADQLLRGLLFLGLEADRNLCQGSGRHIVLIYFFQRRVRQAREITHRYSYKGELGLGPMKKPSGMVPLKQWQTG